VVFVVYEMSVREGFIPALLSV